MTKYFLDNEVINNLSFKAKQGQVTALTGASGSGKSTAVKLSASLDAESETKVQKALSTLVRGKTVIITANRMRTVANADHVIVLDKGMMLEEGTPEHLMKQKGTFAKMVNTQMQAAEWKL